MYNNKYYKTVTWVVSTSGKIVSLITADLSIFDQTGPFRVDNYCTDEDEDKEPCVSNFLVKESAIEVEKEDMFDVSVYLATYNGVMRGCEMKNVIIKGLNCLLLFNAIFVKTFV